MKASSDLTGKTLSFHGAILTAVWWVVAIALPFMVADAALLSDPMIGGALAVLVGYCIYTGVRTLRRGDKVRFIVRIVVPASLMAVSSLFVLIFM